ncbi:MAG: phage major capsid protein, partial [Limnochordales bacterium]
MNRQEYVEKRKALVAEAEAYAAEGSVERFNEVKAQIEALDREYEAAIVARANARALQEELKVLQSRTVGADEPALVPGTGQVVDTMQADKARVITRWGVQASAERGRALKAMNAVKLTTEGVLVPTRYGTDLMPAWNEVSSLIDLVRIFPRIGGEAFERSYVRGYGEGQEVADDADYHESDTEFGFVRIGKSKVTVYTEEDEGVLKLPDIDYDAEIVNGVRIALRKRIARQILVGPGTANRLTGIFASNYSSADPKAGAIDPATDLQLATIDDGTLDEIIFSYGGEEDVESGAALILNKQDLKAFAKLRDGNGNRVHTISYNGNTGLIDGIPFIINSACGVLSAAGTAPDTYCMAYGHLSNYGLAIFSDIDIQRSTDYKFRSGQVAHRGSVYVGGNVIKWNGFVRVKKAA